MLRSINPCAAQETFFTYDNRRLSYGTAVRLTGNWTASQGSAQSHELQVSSFEVLGANDAETSPLQPKYQTPEYLRTIPHLRARTVSNALLLHLRSQLIATLTNFFNQEGFVQTHTPIITSSDCEGAGEVFTLAANSVTIDGDGDVNREHHFFEEPKYLTVSAQLHLEALAQAVSKVWTLSPTFRAEESDTSRHLSEFYMLEAEVCFANNLDEIMDLVENMLRFATTSLWGSRVFEELLALRQNSDDKFVSAEAVQERWEGMIFTNWPRMTYTEAISNLQQAARNGVRFNFPPSYEGGLQSEHERYLAAEIGKGKPVFVTDYPRAQKPFYMPPSGSPSSDIPSTDTVACFDLLVPDLAELVGGSLRQHRLEELQQAMQEKGLSGEDLDWYQDLRRYGSVPHGGFGLGFDRLLCYLAGVSSVRDIVAFPRWYGRCDC
jgi:asparaginyl-tRNA synthetase